MFPDLDSKLSSRNCLGVLVCSASYAGPRLLDLVLVAFAPIACLHIAQFPKDGRPVLDPREYGLRSEFLQEICQKKISLFVPWGNLSRIDRLLPLVYPQIGQNFF